MNHDFISAGLFNKTEEGTGFHSAKSFDSVLCSKSETIMFLATTQRQINSVNTSCALVYLPSL